MLKETADLEKIRQDLISLEEQMDKLEVTMIRQFSDSIAVFSALEGWCNNIRYQVEQLLIPEENPPEP